MDIQLLCLSEKAFRLKKIGDEVYYTNSLIVLLKNMLFNKLPCQNILIEKPFRLDEKQRTPLQQGCARDVSSIDLKQDVLGS